MSRDFLPQHAAADNATMEPSAANADPPIRKRRWYQFSLRTLFVFVLFFAAASAWFNGKAYWFGPLIVFLLAYGPSMTLHALGTWLDRKCPPDRRNSAH